MNRFIKKTAAILLSLSLAAGLGACHKKDAVQQDGIDQIENIITGSWEEAESPVIPSDVMKAFEKAMDGLVGANYTPVAYLGSQIVSGHNYMLLCRVAPVTADPVETYAIVSIYEDTEGNAQMTNVSDFGVETYLGSEGMTGGWSQPETPELPDDVKEAFEKAAGMRTDIAYHPVALLSQQVVAGMNYRILCEADNVLPGYDTNYAIITVYNALDGSAEISDLVQILPAEE